MESEELENFLESFETQYPEFIYRGVEVYYSKVCPTKLWFFIHDLGMEYESDLVVLGKILHEKSYPQEAKEILVSEKIKIDFISRRGGIIIHEVKHSDRLSEADELQVLYYIYYLKSIGVKNVYGVIHYPRLKKKIYVKPSDEDFRKLFEAFNLIDNIKKMDRPPEPVMKKICRLCSYYNLCWVT